MKSIAMTAVTVAIFTLGVFSSAHGMSVQQFDELTKETPDSPGLYERLSLSKDGLPVVHIEASGVDAKLRANHTAEGRFYERAYQANLRELYRFVNAYACQSKKDMLSC